MLSWFYVSCTKYVLCVTYTYLLFAHSAQWAEPRQATFFVFPVRISALKYFCSALILVIALGGLVVTVLATGPKVRGFDPCRGRWIFKGDKNP
jgi:hypothetical protein